MRTVKIVTLDDDPAIRAAIVGYFEQIGGYTVLEAEDGQSAIDCCRSERPDLLLCDLRLPDISGFEVLTTVTRELPDMPVIMVSMVNELSEAVKAFKLGAWDYITKPLTNMALLEHAIEQALERAQLRKKTKLYQEYLEQTNKRLEVSLQQLKDDEQAGRQLQFQLLPPNNISFGDFHFSHRLWTSLYLSGDFIDYFEIDNDHIGFYMADVSGHGVSSAFVTVLLKSYMNRYLELYRQGKSSGILNPAKIFTRLNRNVLKSNTNKHLTMFYGIINKSENRLYYSNGGQFPYPLLFDGDGVRAIECKSKPVGLFDFAEYHINTLELPQQFAMVLLSDGILEVLPHSKIRDKRHYLAALVEQTRFDSEAFARQLGEAIGVTLPDDITLLHIRKRDKTK